MSNRNGKGNKIIKYPSILSELHECLNTKETCKENNEKM
jgi:hypothetical protein